MKWTCGEYYKVVVRLTDEGKNAKEIAVETGTKPQDVWNARARYRERGTKIFESKRALRSHDETERIRAESVKLFNQGLKIPEIVKKLECGYDIVWRAVIGSPTENRKSRSAAELEAGIEVGNRIRRIKETIKVNEEVIFRQGNSMNHGTVKEIYQNFVRVDTGDGKVNVQYVDLI